MLSIIRLLFYLKPKKTTFTIFKCIFVRNEIFESRLIQLHRPQACQQGVLNRNPTFVE